MQLASTQKQMWLPALLICIGSVLFVCFPHVASADVFEEAITGSIYGIMVGFGGYAVWLGGWLFDSTIQLLVLDMGNLLSGDFGAMIDNLWSIIRDICNILFIFSLIYIGFKTIWNAGDSSTRRQLGMLIVAALLINFSLFFTKLVIDFSNIAAIQIYNLVQVQDQNGNQLGVKSLADALLEEMDLQTYANQGQEGVLAQEAQDNSDYPSARVLGFGFLMMIFLLVTAFVFLAGAILLSIRFVVLVFLMIFSPLLLIGWIMPAFKGMSEKRFKQLIDNAMFAPAFLFMIYLSLSVIQALYTEEGTGGFAAALNPHSSDTEGGAMILVQFIIIIGLMVGSLLVAKQMGAVGADKAVSVGNTLQKKGRIYAGNAAFGTAGAIGRSTVGQWAQRRSESDGLLDRASKGGVSGWAARRELAATRFAGNSSFDARHVGGVGKALGIGEGSKDGYKTRRDNYAKDRAKFAESLGEVSDDDKVVKTYKDSVELTEVKIENLKAQKQSTNDENRQKEIQRLIESEEKSLKTQKEDLTREKARRQMGSVAFGKTEAKDQQELTQLQQEQRDARERFKEAQTPEERTKEAEIIREKKKAIAATRKKLRQGGLANMYKNASSLSSLLSGHVPQFDVNAGKEIEKKYSKKLKETDEDKRTASMISAIKENNKKDS